MRCTYNELFSSKINWPFGLMLTLLIINSFRPDRLLPGGDVLMYVPTLIIAVLLVKWLSLQDKEIKNIQTRFYFLLVIFMMIQLPFVRNFGFSKAIFESTLFYGITTYLFIIHFIDTFPRVNLYIRLYTVCGVFLALLGLSSGRVDVPILSDENDFCLYVNCLIPFAFFLSQEVKSFKKKIGYYLLIAIFVSANMASFSRGGFIGLAAVGVYLFFQTQKKGLYLLILSVAAVSIIGFAPPEYLAEISTIDADSHTKGTGQQRIESWKAGWQMFKDNPLLGVGVGNYGPWLPDYWEGVEGDYKMWGRAAHSLYFTLISEMGLVGTILFIGMLLGNIRDHRFIGRLEKEKGSLITNANISTKKKEEVSESIRTLYYFSNAYIGSLAAYLATGIFISVLWYKYFWILTAFWVMTGNLARKINKMLLDSSHLQYDSESSRGLRLPPKRGLAKAVFPCPFPS